MPVIFEVSAPGKIILHGEHSVVYNKPAIAGPIDLKTYFKFRETRNDHINFVYKRLVLESKLTLVNANLLLSELDCNETVTPMDFLQKFRSSKEFIFKYVELVGRNLNEKEEMAVGATLYIFNRILRKEKVERIKRSFDVEIDSDMSIGAGVGSSASYGVCLAAGFFMLTQIIHKKLNRLQWEQFTFDGNTELLEKISQWAFDSEVIMHEKPSGIDNTICTYGKLVKFNRGETPVPIKMTGKIDILLVDTGVTRSTSNVVGQVADFTKKYSNIANSIFDAIGHLVNDVVSILESNKNEEEKYMEMSLLTSVNNNLLRSLGVSHPRLENIFKIAEDLGCHVKLTGAGAGGCAFILLPPSYLMSDEYQELCESLVYEGFEIMATSIGGSGVDFKLMEA